MGIENATHEQKVRKRQARVYARVFGVVMLGLSLAALTLIFASATTKIAGEPSGFSPIRFSYGNRRALDAPSVESAGCVHTSLGGKYIADDAGFVCRWQDLDESGCCIRPRGPDSVKIPKKERLKRYSCDYCNSTQQCCTQYEFCVSCCLGVEHVQERPLVAQSVPQRPQLITHHSNPFEYCRAKCRTSSQSVQRGNKYRSGGNYCFGESAGDEAARQSALANADPPYDSALVALAKRKEEENEARRVREAAARLEGSESSAASTVYFSSGVLLIASFALLCTMLK